MKSLLVRGKRCNLPVYFAMVFDKQTLNELQSTGRDISKFEQSSRAFPSIVFLLPTAGHRSLCLHRTLHAAVWFAGAACGDQNIL